MRWVSAVGGVALGLLVAASAWPGDERLQLEETLATAVAARGEMSGQAARARRDLIRHLIARQRYREALPHLRAQLAFVSRREGARSDTAVDLMEKLGRALSTVGLLGEARRQMEEVARLRSERFGEGHHKTLEAEFQLGRLLLSLGEIERAVALLERVVEGYRREFGDNHPKSAMAQVKLAVAYGKGARLDEAERLLIRAGEQIRYRAGLDSMAYLQARYELAALYQNLGRLEEAEHVIQEAYVLAPERLGMDHPLVSQLLRQLGRIYSDQGRYAEAERIFVQTLAARSAALGDDSAKTLGVKLDLSGTYLSLRKHERAETLLREVLAEPLMGSAEYAKLRERAAYQLGRLHGRLGRHEEAAERLDEALALGAGGGDTVMRAKILRALGGIEMARGESGRAVAHLTRALGVAEAVRGPQSALVGMIRAELAEAHAERREYAEAVSGYREAIASMTGFLSRQFTQSAEAREEQEGLVGRAYRMYLKLLVSAHEEGIELGLDPVAEGFTVAERSRGRSLQRALLGMNARAVAGTPELAGLVREEQEVRRRIGLVEAELSEVLGRDDPDQYREYVKELRERRVDLLERLAGIGRRLRGEYPRYDRLMAPEAAAVADVRARLEAGEAMLAYLVRGDETLLWAVRRDRVALYRLPLGGEELERRVRGLRRALDVAAGSLEEIPPYDVGEAHALYQALVAPAEGVLAGARRLIVVPHGALVSLPFGALLRRPAPEHAAEEPVLFAHYGTLDWLARDYALSVAPSATVWLTLREHGRPSRAELPLTGFGDPRFADEEAVGDGVARRGGGLRRRGLPAGPLAELRSLPRLPDTAEELRRIAAALGGDPKHLHLREAASESRVKGSELERFRVVAFSTHGLLAGELKGLEEPALALTPPERPSEEDDGLLRMSEVLGLSLDADWVVLSACNSAGADGSIHGEGLSGLARAFFYAGSRAMLVTLWSVESRSAQMLVSSLFEATRSRPGIARSEALALAQRRLIEGEGYAEGGRELFRYAHPLFWAPFVVVGEGDGGVAARTPE